MHEAALQLMLELDVRPQLLSSSQPTFQFEGAAGQHSVLAVAAHALAEVGHLHLTVTDWS